MRADIIALGLQTCSKQQQAKTAMSSASQAIPATASSYRVNNLPSPPPCQGHDLATLPDFPAEIRAPTGTRYGVSAFQIQFGGDHITTPGDTPDVLIAFNPAALVVNLANLSPQTLVIVDANAFTDQRIKRADLTSNPLTDGTMDAYQVVDINITDLTVEAVKPHGLGTKDAGRCKNFWALGLILWMFDQSRSQTQNWIQDKFANNEKIREANLAALNAGNAYAENTEFPQVLKQPTTLQASLAAVEYRTITGAESLALGLVAAGELADTQLMFCSYPITPASSLLHHLVGLEDAGVATYQAEDEIAAICAAIGSSYAGKLGVTSSSGPGVALKNRSFGLGRSHRATLGAREQSACRPFNRHANKNRAKRSLSSRLWPQR